MPHLRVTDALKNLNKAEKQGPHIAMGGGTAIFNWGWGVRADHLATGPSE